MSIISLTLPPSQIRNENYDDGKMNDMLDCGGSGGVAQWCVPRWTTRFTMGSEIHDGRQSWQRGLDQPQPDSAHPATAWCGRYDGGAVRQI